MNILLVVAELLHEDERTDAKNATDAFPNFSTAFRNEPT